eukprot:gene30763-35802_t
MAGSGPRDGVQLNKREVVIAIDFRKDGSNSNQMRPQAALQRVKNCNGIMQQEPREPRESQDQIATLRHQVGQLKNSHFQVEGELHKQTKYNESLRSTMEEELKKSDTEKRSMQQEIHRLNECWENEARMAYHALKEKDSELEKLKQRADQELHKLTEENGRIRHQTAEDLKKRRMQQELQRSKVGWEKAVREASCELKEKDMNLVKLRQERDAEKRSMQQEIECLKVGQMKAERVSSQAFKEKDKELEKLKQGLKAECDEKDSLQEELDLLGERCADKSQEFDRLQLELHEAGRQIKALAGQRGKESLQETSSNWVHCGNSVLPSGNQELALSFEAGQRAPTNGLSFEMGHGTTEMRQLLQSLCIGLEKWSEKIIRQGKVGLGASQKHLYLEDCHAEVAVAELESGSLAPQLLQHHTLHLLVEAVWPLNATSHDVSNSHAISNMRAAPVAPSNVKVVADIVTNLHDKHGYRIPTSAKVEWRKGVSEGVDITMQLHGMMSCSKHPLKMYCSIPGGHLRAKKHGTPLREITTSSWIPVAHDRATGISPSSHGSGWVVVGVGPDQSKDLKEGTCRSEDCLVCLTVTPGIELLNRQDEGGAVLVPEEVYVIKLLQKEEPAAELYVTGKEQQQNSVALQRSTQQQQEQHQHQNDVVLTTHNWRPHQ